MQTFFSKILSCFFILSSCLCTAQTNLVPNPSFENYITCPTTLGDYEAASWWVSSQTPDYYNPCASYSTCVSAPNTGQGFVSAFDGSAMSAFITTEYGVTSDYREYISSQLTSTLTIGTKYYFSMEVLRKEGLYPFYGICSSSSNGATNKMGALFTTNKYDATHVLNPKNFAHIYEPAIITDTINWIQVKGSFIADSAYQYINLGNFFDDNHTDTVRSVVFSNNPGFCQAYYFVDEIKLSTDSLFVLGISSINNTEQKNILHPNPSTNGYIYSTIDFANDKILVYDVLDFLVKQDNIANGNTINLNDLENGIYIIEINNTQYRARQKITINKQ